MDKFLRKPNRLPDFDYSQNAAYFITICTENRVPLFWKDMKWIPTQANQTPPLSEIGLIVEKAISQIATIYPLASIEKYSIMPDHLHLILSIALSGNIPDQAITISRIIKQMKGWVTKTIQRPIWQKGFYDRVIRSGKEFSNIWVYIDNNPLNWQNDVELNF